MPKGTINKIQVDKPVFMTIVHECGSSIIKLGACAAIDCTERTIRRSLNEGKMTPCFLDQIARYLNVDSRLLSGELHRKADLYGNDILRSLYLAHLKAGNYPYFKKIQADLNKQPMGELLEQILALFEVSFSQYEVMDFEAQYLFQHDLLDSLVPVIRKHFNADAYGRKEMPNLEKVISDLENFREDHSLRIYAEDVLRKRYLENPPRGKSKVDICRMSAEELIDLDMDPCLVKW